MHPPNNNTNTVGPKTVVFNIRVVLKNMIQYVTQNSQNVSSTNEAEIY